MRECDARTISAARYSTLDSLPHVLFKRPLLSIGKYRLCIHRYEPLLLDLRLDRAATAAVGRDVVHVAFVYLHDESFLFQFLYDERARFLDVLAREFSRVREEDAALVDDGLDIEAVPLRDIEVDSGMRGSDGHHAGTHRHIRRLILDDGRLDRAVDPFGIDFF